VGCARETLWSTGILPLIKGNYSTDKVLTEQADLLVNTLTKVVASPRDSRIIVHPFFRRP
jgi:hypothetical protein